MEIETMSAGSEIEPVTKRARADEPELTVVDDRFTITFDCTSALRTLVEVVAAILCRAEFKVSRMNNDGEGMIHVESIDPRKSCLVVAHLECRLSNYQGEPRFTVNTTDFNHCLRSVPGHYAVDLVMKDNSKMCVHAYESLSKTHEMCFNISTLVNDVTSVKMSELDYDLTIEVDTVSLRRIVRNCMQLHGQDLLFKVQQHRNAAEQKRYTVLTVESEGTTVHQQERFHSVTDVREGTSTVIRTEHEETIDHKALEAEGVLQTVFEESYAANYLNLFLKNLDKHMLTMRLSEGKPLVLTYPLGSGEESYVCLVLATKVKSAM